MRVTLRLALPWVLATALHATPRLGPIRLLSSNPSLENVPSIDISPHTLPRSDIPVSSSNTHLSSLAASEARFNVPGIKKHVFRVPDTNVILVISLGKRLDRVSLASFLDVTEDFVTTQTVRYGYDTVLPMGMFEWDTGEEVEIIAESSLAVVHQMTWGVLKDAVKGLQDFLVGLKYYREAACRVKLADPAGSFMGYIDLQTRLAAAKINVARSLPTVSVVKQPTNSSTSPLGIHNAVQIDIRPQWRRLDLIAVRNILAITKDWAEEKIERHQGWQRIPYRRIEKTLGEGVELLIVEAPGKDLTYELVNETTTRLLAWELNVGKGKAIEFGILKQGVLKGAGSIRKDKSKGLDVV